MSLKLEQCKPGLPVVHNRGFIAIIEGTVTQDDNGHFLVDIIRGDTGTIYKAYPRKLTIYKRES